METKPKDYVEIFNKLFQGVIDTNKLFGLNRDEMSEEEIENLKYTYFQLRQEEGKEIFHAIETEDKVEYLDGLIDLLVVGSFEYYLSTGKVFKYSYDNNLQHEALLVAIEVNLNQQYQYGCEQCLYAAMDILTKLDIDLEKAINEVLESNKSKAPTMSDFCSVMEKHSLINHRVVTVGELVETQCDIIEGEGRYTGVYCEKVFDNNVDRLRLTFWATHDKGVEKHKFVKPVTYFDADFASCWNN